MTADTILERLSSLHPKVIDLSLDRLQWLLAALDHPERRLPPVIHIAGTNGKGSSVAMLRAIHEAAGRRVHAYITPHLVRFAERFTLAGAEITEPALVDILEECEAVNQGRPITQFEITTAAGMLAFARTPADLLLLEVGLGGRLDATNVIDRPALSVITPVSMDHQFYLGETIEAIAFEKAGILKPGVPAVIARQTEAALAVIEEQAAQLGAPLAIEGRDWTVAPDGDGIVFRTASMTRHLPRPALPGAHQIGNAGIALAAAEILQSRFPLSAAALAEGMRKVRWPARLQRLTRGPLLGLIGPQDELWLDGGHNVDAARVIAGTVQDWVTAEPHRPTHLVFGALNARDPKEFLSAFKGLVAQVRTVAIPGQPNTISAEDGAAAGRGAGLDANASPSVTEAIGAICSNGEGPRRILICGSLYLAGTVLRDHG
jgi:dihydrofolate synthase/folylpolyglutamate synthase